MPEHYLEGLYALILALPSSRLADLAIGLLTFGLLLLWPRVSRSLPAPLVALGLAAAAAALLARLWPQFSVATIESRFWYLLGGVRHSGIPQQPPWPGLPWLFPGPDGAPLRLSWQLFRTLVPPAFAIAMLGAIESLLSAVVSDGMTGKTHDPDAELMAQGVGNILAPFFGGIAATGAIARTATGVRAGRARRWRRRSTRSSSCWP
jgi:SulP family sulfate permease